MLPGRTQATRPTNDAELRATLVLRLPIDEGSAKVRTGPPKDDDEDLDLTHWAGVVPLTTVAGAPEQDPAQVERVGPLDPPTVTRPSLGEDGVRSSPGRRAAAGR